MTREEFIDKWCFNEDREGMDFDLVSVARQMEQERMETLIHERYGEPEEEIKAYTMSKEEALKHIKKVHFGGGMRGQ